MAFKNSKQRKAVMAKLQIKRNKFGFISQVTNPEGKGNVAIVQRINDPGFTITQDKAPFRKIKSGFRNDDTAIKFAVKTKL